jgi:hypothetical protein
MTASATLHADRSPPLMTASGSEKPDCVSLQTVTRPEPLNQMKALRPVIALPTISVFISRVPSYE